MHVLTCEASCESHRRLGKAALEIVNAQDKRAVSYMESEMRNISKITKKLHNESIQLDLHIERLERLKARRELRRCEANINDLGLAPLAPVEEDLVSEQDLLSNDEEKNDEEKEEEEDVDDKADKGEEEEEED